MWCIGQFLNATSRLLEASRSDVYLAQVEQTESQVLRVAEFPAQLDGKRRILGGDGVTSYLSIAEDAVGLELGIRIALPGRELYRPQYLCHAGFVVIVGEQHAAIRQERPYRAIGPPHALRKFDALLE
jgi:hypothetical protein